jgi:succinate dehydrogenase / fumarate reductase, cytochrome b subunit
MTGRPLSPHLSVYRFAYTMALSILHRGTGLALSVGTLLFVAWLAAAASGAEAYATFTGIVGGQPVRVLVGAWVVAYVYHFANGIRHLFWDIGWGLERAQARRSGQVVVVSVIVAAAALVYGLFFAGGAS